MYEDDSEGPPTPGVASKASSNPVSPSLPRNQAMMPSFASSNRQA